MKIFILICVLLLIAACEDNYRVVHKIETPGIKHHIEIHKEKIGDNK